MSPVPLRLFDVFGKIRIKEQRILKRVLQKKAAFPPLSSAK